ncbi:hypothetical protein FVER53590_10518 [Fusarium verticillioides]|nr:hypothetical protein FVER53590_10518 [Fusarium verticillioides]
MTNDMTSREGQRGHKQFFIGNFPDPFCPILSQVQTRGRLGVSKDRLPSDLKVETHVNGGLRQSSTTGDLILYIPSRTKITSEYQTLRPGDFMVTGTLVLAGIGTIPLSFLSPGDAVFVSVTGPGTLSTNIGTAETVFTQPSSGFLSTRHSASTSGQDP